MGNQPNDSKWTELQFNHRSHQRYTFEFTDDSGCLYHLGEQLWRFNLYANEHHHQRSNCFCILSFYCRSFQRSNHDNGYTNQHWWCSHLLGHRAFAPIWPQLWKQQRQHLGYTVRFAYQCHLHSLCQQQWRFDQHHLHTRSQLDAHTERRGCLHHPKQFPFKRHHLGMGLRPA